MELTIKRFNELSVQELYELLKLRVSVFVVEQNCPYPELDDRDQGAIHLWLSDERGILAYARVLDRGVNGAEVSIGRVIAAERRRGLGSRILAEAIRVAEERFNASVTAVEAQVYARGLYEKLGYRQVSEVFWEDGIPHIWMIRDRSDDRAEYSDTERF